MFFRGAVIAVMLVVACTAADEEDDYYEILNLGVERDDAGEKQIKTNWRKLSREHHPDLKGESSRAFYQKIQRANEVLSDKRKRKAYDMKGEEGVKQLEMQQQSGGQQQQDPFAQMFGFGGGGGGQQGAQRGKNVQMMLLVTLEDVYNGESHTMKLNKQRLCKKCRGTGANSKDDYKTCTQCNGAGVVMQRVQIAPGFVQEMQNACPRCGGKGKSIAKKCSQCKGKRVSRVDHTLHLEIEQGLPENHDLVFDMEADQTPDQIPGDVVFSVTTAPHKTFSRRANTHLDMTMKLSLEEALLGFEKKFTHLDGREVKVQEKGVVQYGQVRRLEGEGMPQHHVPSEKGEMAIKFEVSMPTSLTQEQRNRLETVL
jgi:DnaJ-class molecular chaperone